MNKTNKANRIPAGNRGMCRVFRQGLALVVMVATCSWGYAAERENVVGGQAQAMQQDRRTISGTVVD
nr:hypothetical protein [Odoribacter sp.]